MTEYELVYLMSEMLNRMWVLLQVWAGVTFGYLALAHIYGRTLNASIVVILTVAFITFSVTISALVEINIAGADGYHADLMNLMESGSLSNGTTEFLQHRNNFAYKNLFGASVLILFICGIFYLPYQHWLGRREGK